MAGPRHLQDPLAHDEKFKALKEEVDEGLEAALSSMFIPGMSIPFSGTFGGSDGKRPINPHTGKANEEFAICDGGTYKSPTGPMMTTPDLRGRFVMGASDKYKAGARGGSETHDHNITVNLHTLTAEQMPSHDHGMNGGWRGIDVSTSGARSILGRGTDAATNVQGGSQAHNHGASASSANHLPPYHALAYIMKL